MTKDALILLIPGADGPVAVTQLAQRPDVPVSLVVSDADQRTLDISADYDELLGESGALRTVLPAISPGSHVLTVDGTIEAGRLWEMPAIFAHWCLTRRHPLAADARQARSLVWIAAIPELDPARPFEDQPLTGRGLNLGDLVQASEAQLAAADREGLKVFAAIGHGKGATAALARLRKILPGSQHRLAIVRTMSEVVVPISEPLLPAVVAGRAIAAPVRPLPGAPSVSPRQRRSWLGPALGTAAALAAISVGAAWWNVMPRRPSAPAATALVPPPPDAAGTSAPTVSVLPAAPANPPAVTAPSVSAQSDVSPTVSPPNVSSPNVATSGPDTRQGMDPQTGTVTTAPPLAVAPPDAPALTASAPPLATTVMPPVPPAPAGGAAGPAAPTGPQAGVARPDDRAAPAPPGGPAAVASAPAPRAVSPPRRTSFPVRILELSAPAGATCFSIYLAEAQPAKRELVTDSQGRVSSSRLSSICGLEFIGLNGARIGLGADLSQIGAQRTSDIPGATRILFGEGRRNRPLQATTYRIDIQPASGAPIYLIHTVTTD